MTKPEYFIRRNASRVDGLHWEVLVNDDPYVINPELITAYRTIVEAGEALLDLERQHFNMRMEQMQFKIERLKEQTGQAFSCDCE